MQRSEEVICEHALKVKAVVNISAWLGGIPYRLKDGNECRGEF